MPNSYKTTGPRVAIHLPAGIVKSLKRIASEEDRSVSAQCRRWIIAAVEAWETKDAEQYYVPPKGNE